ncbi:MAG TPA: hypothetical protein VKR23_09945 [Gaiellaceae bacterium]|nr:hypothetical protein [Gaiellaceae bacterium]
MRGGPAANERLTSATGLVLLVLLAVETLTTLVLGTFLDVHLFLGLLLLPVVALKLGSTGWRFARYYTRNPAYRAAGPPQPLLRTLAPLLVAATLLLFGTGVALLIQGHGGGELRTLHTFSFIAWGVLVGIHVLAYLTRIVRDGTADWRPRAGAGARARRALLLGSLLAGVVVALATYSTQQSFLAHHHHRDDFRRGTSAIAPPLPRALVLRHVTVVRTAP